QTGDPVTFEREICFQNVSFVYPYKQTQALKDISLSIPKGKVVALVGVSGAGKSSLIDLLLRFYNATQGAILIDGKNIESFPLEIWRNLFGVVPQDAFLFNETIEDNIRFARLNATREEIVWTAQCAGADTFIRSLPQGYQTVVGEKGYRLSGGERQR